MDCTMQRANQLKPWVPLHVTWHSKGHVPSIKVGLRSVAFLFWKVTRDGFKASFKTLMFCAHQLSLLETFPILSHFTILAAKRIKMGHNNFKYFTSSSDFWFLDHLIKTEKKYLNTQGRQQRYG